MRRCWCGASDLRNFSPEYSVCAECGTLVSQQSLTDDQLFVNNDDTDFYGKQYWIQHQQQDLGFPDIHARARNDLVERNLHWLRALLKYCLPPAKVMELGCAHGSFVALLRQAGYDAFGVEMSPWVVEFGKRAFGIPVSVGPVENLSVPEGSLDAIALMDVLEHLPNPVATMAHCLRLLKPDGLLLIQTPQFREEMDFARLSETKGAFLEQLKADEHLYLFTDHSVSRLFRRLGIEHIQFEPAIFSHYDMFLVASRTQLQVNVPESIDSALPASSPSGRFALALLDLYQQVNTLSAALSDSETDREARGKQIEALTTLLHESEKDRAARGQQIESLTAMVHESEADRAARGKQIEALTTLLHESEEDRVVRGQQIESLTAMVHESEADRAARGKQIEALTMFLHESEEDRAARGQQANVLTARVCAAEAKYAAQGEQIALLKARVCEAEDKYKASVRMIETLNSHLDKLEADRTKQHHQIESLSGMLREVEADRAEHAKELEYFVSKVRLLSSRPGFRYLAKFSKWPEIKELSRRIGTSDE